MDTLRICQQCRQPLPGNAPEGLCPSCLAKVVLGSEPAATKAKSDEPASTISISPEAFVRVRYFGDYELLEEIARGGMGVVWKARQSSLNRTVALKMILAGKLAGDAEVQRFRREAEAAANLQHPNIVAIHEVGEHDGQHYYSMDYVAGRDLGVLVRESGPLPPVRAAECLKSIAEAVHFAHLRGTLHRDLKPQNVLMDAVGVPRITDFGLAKFVERDDSLTQTGAAMGSPSYMPPEQAAGHLDQVGPHSDVYSLGAILYELLTGRPPFRAETAVATMRQVMESDPVAPRKLNSAVPPNLETICLKCLEKNPARRYPSARALGEELGRFLKHEPIQAVRVSAIRKAESWLRRHPWTMMAAASLVAMVLTGLLYWQYEQVNFLQTRPLQTGQAPSASLVSQDRSKALSLGQELSPWNDAIFPVVFLTLFANGIFSRYRVKALKQVSLQPTGWTPYRPVSQLLRVVFGLIGGGAFGFTMVYFAKLIRVAVWETTPDLSTWAMAYASVTLSISLLFDVARDYQRFVHGMPSPTAPAQLAESLKLVNQKILDGDISRALKLYRRAVPGASAEEADEHVRRLEAELRVKHPEKFAPPPEMSDLAFRQWTIIVLLVFLSFWSLRVVSGLFSCAAGFILGAGILLLRRLKSLWHQRQAEVRMTVCFVVALSTMLQLRSSYKATLFFFGGTALGVCTIVFGFPRKRRKSVAGKSSPTDDAPSH